MFKNRSFCYALKKFTLLMSFFIFKIMKFPVLQASYLVHVGNKNLYTVGYLYAIRNFHILP